MPRAVKDPKRAKITEEHVGAVLLGAPSGYDVSNGLTAKDVARAARWFANERNAWPPMNERDVEIVHGFLRILKAEGRAETCGVTRTEKGSGKPPLLWRVVRHG